MSTITTERLTKILSETQSVIGECNSRGVHGSVEVNARLFENVLMELLWHRAAMFQDVKPDFREIGNSSTNNCRENEETSTNCPKCGGRGSYHCPQMLGTVECECTLPATSFQEVKPCT